MNTNSFWCVLNLSIFPMSTVKNSDDTNCSKRLLIVKRQRSFGLIGEFSFIMRSAQHNKSLAHSAVTQCRSGPTTDNQQHSSNNQQQYKLL